jgi:hypothetical protein
VPRVVNQIKSPTGVLKLGLTAVALDQDASCQFTHARLVTTANSQEIPETGCAPPSTTYSASSWALEVNFLQDYTEPTGIVLWSYDHDAETVFFELYPNGDVIGEVMFAGQCTVSALPIGGDVGPVLATDNATWPCPDKPTHSLVAAAGTAAAESEAEEAA